jgi:hypothetical protein
MVIIDVLLITVALCVNDVRKAYLTSENAIDAIVNELQHGIIIAIGEGHERVNEQLFIADNIQALYNAGVRYIFAEGGASLEESLPSSESYNFLMFYPWIGAGWRYETIALYQAVTDLNNALPSDDKIIICGVEHVPDNVTDLVQRFNLRDISAAETIIGIMDTAAYGTKAIVWYGMAHTGIYPFKRYYKPDISPYKFARSPLGYLLKKHYGSDFSSFYFATGSDEDLLLGKKQILDETKLVLQKNMPLVNRLLPDQFQAFIPSWTISKRYDGFIFEPEEINGTYYNYNPTNENLSFIFKVVEDYALECSPDADYTPLEPKSSPGVNYLKEEIWANFDYVSPPSTYYTFDPQGQLMHGLYYLKLFFGDKFDYSFWKTESSKNLLSALAELKDYAFANRAPAEYVRTNYSRDTIIPYHEFMTFSLVFRFNKHEMPARNIREMPLLQARVIFPEDLWPLYWLGFAATEKKQWEKGLGFFQELFADDLSYSMESLPLAYQKAALCAEKTGNSQLAEEYRHVAGTLFNEYNIIVDKNEYSYVGY